MATTLDCLLHPIDCANASAAAQSVRAAGQAAVDTGHGLIADAGAAVSQAEDHATAPLSQIASTSMWITIGIIVVSIVFLIVFGYIVLKVI